MPASLPITHLKRRSKGDKRKRGNLDIPARKVRQVYEVKRRPITYLNIMEKHQRKWSRMISIRKTTCKVLHIFKWYISCSILNFSTACLQRGAKQELADMLLILMIWLSCAYELVSTMPRFSFSGTELQVLIYIPINYRGYWVSFPEMQACKRMQSTSQYYSFSTWHNSSSWIVDHKKDKDPPILHKLCSMVL